MSEATIPVDLANPGQVFASLGLIEAADVLLGSAEGGFEWDSNTRARFTLRAGGSENPMAAVIAFLSRAKVAVMLPAGQQNGLRRALSQSKTPVSDSEWFPGGAPDRMALPVRLTADGSGIDIFHWCDGSGCLTFKLYAGNRSAHGIALAMIDGTKETAGVKALAAQRGGAFHEDPFNVLTSMSGSFNLDPRGGWTALDAGYSPNEHQNHFVASSPVVEILAAIGLQNARPEEYATRRLRYAVWNAMLSAPLARAALCGASIVPSRRFRFTLAMSGKNKVVTFANEEISV